MSINWKNKLVCSLIPTLLIACNMGSNAGNQSPKGYTAANKTETAVSNISNQESPRSKRMTVTLTNQQIGTYLKDRLEVSYSGGSKNGVLFNSGSVNIDVPEGATNVHVKVIRIQFGGASTYFQMSVPNNETRNLCIITTGGVFNYFTSGSC